MIEQHKGVEEWGSTGVREWGSGGEINIRITTYTVQRISGMLRKREHLKKNLLKAVCAAFRRKS
ncbi:MULTISPECIES: hypothetical protein [Okeania]|uniref:Uncharacterized protein n=1 Tax=Okeania hirsuta TaxID=1458930 RepID=A0A3N6NRQ6_9CYAN|nr:MULTISPECIES: hypothetical protein [Okeania]NET78041.1 hypothetical protein [Okeania sp. SIO1F9]RQH20986.1 hypothetical protein D4Z78_10620 [Okeania hirsuta]RQH49116.1 hypothetical protein D5R40_06975 [Okeania hirsuta]